ncbi:MAG: hypothetical protein H0U75_08410 [Legionella sp.]|nr:hypothetical protein [Legionella sp.]
MKILLIFAGTLESVSQVRNFYEETIPVYETFKDDVIRIYFSGSQDKEISGNYMLANLTDPDLNLVAKKIRNSMDSDNERVSLNLKELKRQFGSSVIIMRNKTPSPSEQVVSVSEISMLGFSRGAVTTFPAARHLDDLNIPISILAEEPVPGDSRAHSINEQSTYAKHLNDLTHCVNVRKVDVVLGTYTNQNSPLGNKMFRQMGPNFNVNSNAHIYIVPKTKHQENSGVKLRHKIEFLRDLDVVTNTYEIPVYNEQVSYIPKIVQQKFHAGVVGRTEFLPGYKNFIAAKLKESKGHDDIRLFKTNKFKVGQALHALRSATMSTDCFSALSKSMLQDTDKGKALREFIVEFDGIIQFSKSKKSQMIDGQIVSSLTKNHLKTLGGLEQQLYKKIADFQHIQIPTLREKEGFEEEIKSTIQKIKGKIPNKVFNQIKELTGLFLKENTLTHPNLVAYIYEKESFLPSHSIAHEAMIDTEVTDAKGLSEKLYFSSLRQRSVIFDQEKGHLQTYLNTTKDLENIIPFLTPKQLKQTLGLGQTKHNNVIDLTNSIGNKINSIQDVLMLMSAAPSYTHRKVVYQTVLGKIAQMKPSDDQLVELMGYMSDVKCKELCDTLERQNVSLQGIEKVPNIQRILTGTKIDIIEAAIRNQQQSSKLEGKKDVSNRNSFFKPGNDNSSESTPPNISESKSPKV